MEHFDPTEVYDQMTAAWRDGDYGTAWQHADSLQAWMAGGGTEPDRTDARYWVGRIHAHYAPSADPRVVTGVGHIRCTTCGRAGHLPEGPWQGHPYTTD